MTSANNSYANLLFLPCLASLFFWYKRLITLVSCEYNIDDQNTEYRAISRIDIIVMLAPITDVINNKGSDPISSHVSLSKDMLYSHHDREAKKSPNIKEDWVDIQMFSPISDLLIMMAKSPSRIIL